MTLVGEHPAVPKIRTLLALAASAVKVGSLGEAAAAGKAARKMADEAKLHRGYIVKARGCRWAQERMIDDDLLSEWILPTPTAVWGYEASYWLAAFGKAKPPSESLIVGVVATGVRNARGCLVLLADWSDVHQPMSIHHARFAEPASLALKEAA